jgi:CubicO group peptidase (beta-lactamase class C family)
MGNGGQMIWVDPALDLVVITTAGGYNKTAPDDAARRIALTVARLERKKSGR